MAANPEQLILDFRARRGDGAFRHADRESVARGMLERIEAPERVATGSSCLCGPSVLMFAVLCDRPEDYARYVIDLFETGRAKLGRLEVQPSRACLDHDGDDVAAVDWIALASLCDTHTDGLDCATEIGCVAMPADLLRWFRRVGYRASDNFVSVWTTKATGTLQSADRLRTRGHRVSVFVDANMLEPGAGDRSAPNRWVALTSPVKIRDAMVDLAAFSWGERAHRLPENGQIALTDFTKHFYGYVTAKC